MNAKLTRRILCERMNCRVLFPSILFCCLPGLNHELKAQDVLAPPPEFSTTPPAVQEYQQQNQLQVFTPAGIVPGAPESPFQWGPLTLRPHALYRFLYGNGIASAPSNHVSTAIQYFSPGILFGYGRHWTLDYTPTWTFYSSKQFRNTLDHSVRLDGGTTYEDWILGLSQSYVLSSAPLVETGTQTDQETYSTALTASYRFNTEMSMDLAVNQNFRSADQFESSREWTTLDWLNYEFWPRLDAGAGVGFGYVNVDTGSDMTYEQLQGRVRWRATDKISFQLHGGAEDRQFRTGGAADLINPVVGGSIQYQPFDTTRLSLNVDRVVAVSLLTTNSQSQVTESTDIMGGLNQRLLGKFYLDLAGGYHTTKYVGSSGGSTGRNDNYYTFNARLSCLFLKRGTASVFYQYTDDSSSQQGFSFSSHQTGVEIGYRF
jgi:hypothetical protein